MRDKQDDEPQSSAPKASAALAGVLLEMKGGPHAWAKLPDPFPTSGDAR